MQNAKSQSKIKIFLVLIFLLLIFPARILAARSIVIDSYKQSFTNDEEGEVKVLLSDFTNGESIFIKGAFSFPDSTNYFGFTKKADGWVKNSITAVEQLSIKVGEWDGKLTVKPDLSDTGFKGSGNYNFKVGFYDYSGGGELTSVNWSDTKTVSITFVPSPTPTPTLTPTPTATPVPTSVPTSSPTNTGVPAATPTTKPLVTPTVYISPAPKKVSPTVNLILSPTEYPTIAETTGTVLGESTEGTSVGKGSGKELPIFLLLLGSGIMFLGAAIVMGLKTSKNK